eukprot:gnl/TRDRNA2_/TRDRNA2_150780_c0_seq2.p2 gnl/TRDRNA2_/TRDRNA2_150780_c0~~gnl/TRDRNA2_/TRDRNA2_150780_c0_seq2.p2  ORF type:complete len:115 (+),score=19.97 gnl/TRDRNA2_/TRDRNA2_150780_c0_seq2:64-408(+)
MFARAALRRVSEFTADEGAVMLVAVSRSGSLADAWHLLEHVKSCARTSGPACYGALLMEHEQQGCLNAGVELLNQIQDAAGSTCGFVAATKLVMAMHLADATRVDVSHCSRRKV